MPAFSLAFTFGIASDRYDTRTALVRDEANAIRGAWRRPASSGIGPDRRVAVGFHTAIAGAQDSLDIRVQRLF